MNGDKPLTFGLIIDVLDVLERHGYHEYDKQHTAHAVLLISDLTRTYAGRDTLPGPIRPAPEAVVITGSDVGPVVTALDLAADYKRDRAETCADCADRSCPACRSRLHDAQAYDRIAARMVGIAEAPDPGRREPQRLGDHDADREVGQ